MKRVSVNPFKKFKQWRQARKVVENSGMSIYASRKTTFPLEDCTSENLFTAAAYNRRNATRYRKAADKTVLKTNHLATAEWNELSADTLVKLAAKLKAGQTVRDLPPRKRRAEIAALVRISQGKAA